MYENTAITVEYIVYKIGVLTKSIEELEQLEKYIIDEEKVIIYNFFFSNNFKNPLKANAPIVRGCTDSSILGDLTTYPMGGGEMSTVKIFHIDYPKMFKKLIVQYL